MRDPADEAIQQQYSAQFQALADATGWPVDGLSDEDHHRIANEVLRQNLAGLYNAAVAADGAGIDPSVNAAFAARLGGTGAGQREAREFAESLYPHLSPREAVARYQRDLQRAAGVDVKEPGDRLFDSPY